MKHNMLNTNQTSPSKREKTPSLVKFIIIVSWTIVLLIIIPFSFILLAFASDSGHIPIQTMLIFALLFFTPLATMIVMTELTIRKENILYALLSAPVALTIGRTVFYLIAGF